MLTNCIESKLFENEKILITESKSSTESESDTKIKLLFTSDFTPLLLNNQEILQVLEQSNKKNEKLYVLNMILQSQFDSTFYYWDLLQILQKYLNEEDNEIFTVTLEIHEKLIKFSWEKLKDAFINLLETLYIYFFSLDKKICIEKYPHRNAFFIYKLVLNTINEVFLHIPSMGYSRLQKIIGNFVDVIFFNTKINNANLTPLNIISSLDPVAFWCKIILYNASSREILFEYMKQNKNVIGCIFHIVVDWICNPFVPKLKELSYASVRYATFVSSIRCCSYFSKYNSFYDMFPIVIEGKFVISLQSFTVLLLSFLKLKTKIIPEFIKKYVIECAVQLLQFQHSNSLVHELHGLLDMLTAGKQMKKYLLEVVRQLFNDVTVLDKVISVIMYSKSPVNLETFLRPRFHSSSDNNIFVHLINTIVHIINTENRSVALQTFDILTNIFKSHKSFLICGPDNYLLSDFIDILDSVCKRKKVEQNGTLINRIIREEDHLFIIGSTPMGYYLLSKSDTLLKTVLFRLQNVETTWLFRPWKNLVPFLIMTESKLNMCGYYRKITMEVLELIHQIMENEYLNELEIQKSFEKILIFVDILSCSVNGISSLMNCNHVGNLENMETEMSSFGQFIEKYALIPTYEYKTQYIALRSLERMIKNFNIRIYLLCFFNYEERLHTIQNNNITVDGKIIKDECSILRAKLLTGYLNERKHESNSTTIKSASNIKLSRKKLCDIEKFLQKTRYGPYDNNWLKYARKSYKNSLLNNIKMSVIVELIEKTAKSISRISKINKLTINNKNDVTILYEEDYKGIILAVRYGIKNKILHVNSTNEENLAQVIKTIKRFVGFHNSENFVEFDCTLATLFIICEGSIEKCLNLVSCMFLLPVSKYIWPQITPHSTKNRFLFGHLLEWILSEEVPNVFVALSKYGISWWLICKDELNNCFWNTMAWKDICHWLCVTVLHSPDHSIYFFTSVAFKNQNRILQATNEYDLRNVLHIIFGSHKFEEHFFYINLLSKKYHVYVSSFLTD